MRFPFEKLLIYLAVLSRYDKKKFAEYLELYLPSVNFQNNIPLDYIKSKIFNLPLPCSIIDGTYSSDAFNIFLKQQKLLDLHSSFDDPAFQDIIFDSDIRLQIDGMSLSNVFHLPDIIKEFPNLNLIELKAYIDCFSDFYKMTVSKAAYVDTYIGDKLEQITLKKICNSSSRKFIRVLLNLKMDASSPQKIISDALNMSDFKVQEAFANDDSIALERWLKMKVVIAEKLHKIGAGSRSDLDELIEKLKFEKDYQDPIIYTKEQLDSLYSEIKDNPE